MGRKLFEKLKYIIKILEFLFKIIPKPLLNFIWFIFDNSENKIALLFRYLYVSKYCKKCGSNIFIGKRVLIKNINSLQLGSNISIHANSYLDSIGSINIGNDVSIAHNSSLISFNHTYNDQSISIKYSPIETGEINILSDVWIGCGSRILANSYIPSRVIVAAGSVVNKKLEANSIYGGVPVRKIKGVTGV
jgi:acetyltransferase-like isoleucine patch superfamily enzyme